MRARLRELGFSIGHFPVGSANAFTDVGGVRVGHTALVIGDGPLEVGKGPDLKLVCFRCYLAFIAEHGLRLEALAE